MRSSWLETGFAMAEAMAARSACVCRRVGAAVASPDWRSWSFGYNGPPSGLVPAQEPQILGGCLNYCPQAVPGSGLNLGVLDSPLCVAVHAEVNAIAQSDRRNREGGTFFVTAAPCWKCALAVANSGVRTVVFPRYEEERRHLEEEVLGMLEACGIERRHP